MFISVLYKLKVEKEMKLGFLQILCELKNNILKILLGKNLMKIFKQTCIAYCNFGELYLTFF